MSKTRRVALPNACQTKFTACGGGLEGFDYNLFVMLVIHRSSCVSKSHYKSPPASLMLVTALHLVPHRLLSLVSSLVLICIGMQIISSHMVQCPSLAPLT